MMRLTAPWALVVVLLASGSVEAFGPRPRPRLYSKVRRPQKDTSIVEIVN